MEESGWRVALAGLAALGFTSGLALLILQVRALLRFLQNRVLAELPFAASAEVTFDHAGQFALGIDRPRLKGWSQPTGSVLADKVTGRNRYRYWLIQAGTGLRIQGLGTVMPLITTTMTRIRYDVARFDVPSAGTWRLQVDGFAPGGDDAQLRWRVTRANHAIAFVGRILGLIAASALTIGGLVGGLLAITA